MKLPWNTLLGHFITGTMLVFFPGCDDSPSRPGEGFYEYTGFRDWRRIPLAFPYHIIIVDSFDSGTLEKYDPETLIGNPVHEMTIVSGITRIGYHERFAAFQQKNQKTPYGIFHYASGKTVLFSSKKELADFIGQNDPDAVLPPMTDLEKFYHSRWQMIDRLRKTVPGKLYYPESDIAPKNPGEGFYSYKGYRNRRRLPWRFPYQIIITGPLDSTARLEEYDPKTLLVRPQHELTGDIIEAGFCRNHLVFRQQNSKRPYGILSIFGKIENFATQEELMQFVKQLEPETPPPKLIILRELYELYWKAPEDVRKYFPEKI